MIPPIVYLSVMSVVLDTICISVISKNNIIRAAKIAANIGGDTDTVAAMACMIIGAHIGASKINQRAIDLICSVNDHPFERVARELSSIEI